MHVKACTMVCIMDFCCFDAHLLCGVQPNVCCWVQINTSMLSLQTCNAYRGVAWLSTLLLFDSNIVIMIILMHSMQLQEYTVVCGRVMICDTKRNQIHEDVLQ